MEKIKKTIDLQSLVEFGYKKFDNRANGIAARKLLNIDACIASADYVEIVVPKHLHSINTLFFEELLENSAISLRTSNYFHKKVKLVGANYSTAATFNETICKIFNEESIAI